MATPNRGDSDNTLLFKMAQSLSGGGPTGPTGPTGPAGVNTIVTSNAVGTAYTMTITAAAAVFGTTSPVVVIPSAGTWRITGRIRVDSVAATFAASRFATLSLTRTNNTLATLAVGGFGLLVLPIATTESSSRWLSVDIIYVTSNSNDSITWFANISALPGAGSITVEEAGITAQKLS